LNIIAAHARSDRLRRSNNNREGAAKQLDEGVGGTVILVIGIGSENTIYQLSDTERMKGAHIRGAETHTQYLSIAAVGQVQIATRLTQPTLTSIKFGRAEESSNCIQSLPRRRPTQKYRQYQCPIVFRRR
jgi:hypothetical protein